MNLPLPDARLSLIPFEAYLAIDAVNVSTLLQLSRSPLHYRHAVEHGGGKDTPAKATGRLAHRAVLEPDKYAAEIAIWDQGDKRGKAWEAFKAEHAGGVIVKEEEHQLCMAISSAVREHPVAGPYLAGEGLAEVTLQWRHRLGVDCKSRLDWLNVEDGVIVDLKTAADASESEFGKSAARLRYHVRAAFYVDAFRALFGADPTFVLIAAEKEPPFAVACYRLPQDALDAGRRVYEKLLGELVFCRERDVWPGLGGDAEKELILPQWAAGIGDELDLVVDGESIRV